MGETFENYPPVGKGDSNRAEGWEPLMQRQPGLASVADLSSGVPVLIGEVHSSKIQGSTVWVPSENIAADRMVISAAQTTVAGTTGLAVVWYTADSEQPNGFAFSYHNDPTDHEVMVIGSIDAGATRYVKIASLVKTGVAGSVEFDFIDGASSGFGQFWRHGTGMKIDRLLRARSFLQAGTESVSLVAATNGSVSVTFPEAFVSTPHVTCTAGDRKYNAAAESISTTGFTCAVEQIHNAAATTSVSVSWTAVVGDA